MKPVGRIHEGRFLIVYVCDSNLAVLRVCKLLLMFSDDNTLNIGLVSKAFI